MLQCILQGVFFVLLSSSVLLQHVFIFHHYYYSKQRDQPEKNFRTHLASIYTFFFVCCINIQLLWESNTQLKIQGNMLSQLKLLSLYISTQHPTAIFLFDVCTECYKFEHHYNDFGWSLCFITSVLNISKHAKTTLLYLVLCWTFGYPKQSDLHYNLT